VRGGEKRLERGRVGCKERKKKPRSDVGSRPATRPAVELNLKRKTKRRRQKIFTRVGEPA